MLLSFQETELEQFLLLDILTEKPINRLIFEQETFSFINGQWKKKHIRNWGFVCIGTCSRWWRSNCPNLTLCGEKVFAKIRGINSLKGPSKFFIKQRCFLFKIDWWRWRLNNNGDQYYEPNPKCRRFIEIQETCKCNPLKNAPTLFSCYWLTANFLLQNKGPKNMNQSTPKEVHSMT